MQNKVVVYGDSLTAISGEVNKRRKAMPKKKQKYADLIYVEITYDDAQDEPCVRHYCDPREAADMDTETEVGIYQFVKTAKVRTKIEVV